MNVVKTVLGCVALSAMVAVATAAPTKNSKSSNADSSAKPPCACCKMGGDKTAKSGDKAKSSKTKDAAKAAPKKGA